MQRRTTAIAVVLNLLVACANGSINGPEACELVVVGAGAGGLYTAWRLIQAGKFNPERTCVFEVSDRPGGRAYSVRADDLPAELVDLGVKSVDVGAYRSSNVLHPFVASLWSIFGLETTCYDDSSFRTGDCTPECDREVFRHLRDKAIPYADWLEDSANSPYRFGPYNDWGSKKNRAKYLTPGEWLTGEFAPDFLKAEFANLALNSSAAVRWAARNRVVRAARTATIGGLPLTRTSTMILARNGTGSGGVRMSQEDFDFSADSDCDVFQEIATRANFYDAVVSIADNSAKGSALLPINFTLPVDPSTGVPIGFVTTVEILQQRLLELGVTFRFREELLRVFLNGQSTQHMLVFSSGLRLRPRATVLNIPPASFEKVIRKVDVEGDKARSTLKGVLSNLEGYPGIKVYPYYERAFWAELGLTSGTMRSTQQIYQTRYHDGFVRCEDMEAKKGCRGTLLAQYVLGDAWFDMFFPGPMVNPYVQIRRNTSDPLQVRYLDEIHEQLMAAHASELEKAGISPSEIPPPNVALVGVFHGDPWWAGHRLLPSDLPPGAVVETALEPFPGYAIHLVNEAYGIPHTGFMDGSLLSAERVLYHKYGLGKPSFFTEDNVFQGFDADLYYTNMVENIFF